MTQGNTIHRYDIISNTTRWELLFLVALLSILLTGMPAQAATEYEFPPVGQLPVGQLPAGCSIDDPSITANQLSTTSYTCGALTLADGDTISVGLLTTPVTVTFTGAFTTAAGNLINAQGTTSDLNIVTNGVLTLGADTILNTNVTGTAGINLGAGSSIGGNITASTTTGVVTLGASSTVGGFIHTDLGAVNVAGLSVVGGDITTEAGVVTLSPSVSVAGGIETIAGGVTVGGSSIIGGDITTEAGVVTLLTNVSIGGGIETIAGGITIGDGSSIVSGSITTEAGVVTLLTNVSVGGDIETIAGGITVGDRSSICGSVITTGAGVVTITTNVQIGGDIRSVPGAITVGSQSTVAGNIIVTGAGVVTSTNNLIGGNISTIAGAITLTDSRVGGSVAASGAGVVTITNSVTNDTTLVVPVSASCSVAAPAFNHFQIEHDGQGLTCASENFTVKVCADTTCSTLYADAIDVKLSINGILDQTVTVVGGSTVASFSYTHPGTATLSIDQTYECKSGDSTSCELIFTDAGFRFLYGAAETTSIGNQTSGNNFADIIKLQAVENVNGVCTGLFTGNVDVELSQQNIAPSVTTGLNFKINGTSGTSIDKYPIYTPIITLDFGAESKATIPMPVYLDAGKIRLYAKYNVGGVSLVGESNDFWVSPARLVVTATAGGSAITGNSSSSAIKHKA
jgi:MSHA biogenesis protein MshQ